MYCSLILFNSLLIKQAKISLSFIYSDFFKNLLIFMSNVLFFITFKSELFSFLMSEDSEKENLFL